MWSNSIIETNKAKAASASDLYVTRICVKCLFRLNLKSLIVPYYPKYDIEHSF